MIILKAIAVLTSVLALFTAGSLSGGEASMNTGLCRADATMNSNEPARSQARSGTAYIYVIVHGASGGGWDWKTIDELLTADGHDVYRPTLTGLGERMHLANADIDLTTHINDIANVILFEDLNCIVLVGHSYAGLVITGVMNRMPERIHHAVFLDAAVPDNGQSAQDLWDIDSSIDHVTEGLVYFSWLEPDTPLPRDVPQSLKTLTEPVSFDNPDALKLPASYVAYLAPGQTAEMLVDDVSLKNARARGWTIRTLSSDHNAQRSHPNELAALLQEAPGDRNNDQNKNRKQKP